MFQSHVIEVEGAFVGAAVRQAGGYRFVAVDVRLDDMDGSVFASLADVQRVARRVALRAQVPTQAGSSNLVRLTRQPPGAVEPESGQTASVQPLVRRHSA